MLGRLIIGRGPLAAARRGTGQVASRAHRHVVVVAALSTKTKAAAEQPGMSFGEMEIMDRDAGPYARSVKRVGKLLGSVMAEGGIYDAALLETVEKLRKQAKLWRQLRGAEDANAAEALFDKIVKDVSLLSKEKLRDVSRSFAHFLALQNAVEAEHRRLRLEATREDGSALFNKLDSCAGTIDHLLNNEGFTIDEVVDQLSKQHLEIVLTAHPTEVHRRTLLAKHLKVGQLLKALDADTLVQGSFEHDELEEELSGVVRSIWGSDELRRTKPTPQKEARAGLSVIETSLWEAAPKFLRRLDATLRKRGGALPIHRSPLKLASWMGGDRDGNPNVTARVTREVLGAQRQKGAELFVVQLEKLRSELSVTKASDALIQRAAMLVPGGPETKEPAYKRLIEDLLVKLKATVDWAEDEIEGETPHQGTPPLATSELLETLLAMHESLTQTGYTELARGTLTDVIRRVQTFGLQLAPLDIRQESDQHAKCIAALREAAGLGGDYCEWTEERKLEWLSAELLQNRPLLRRGKFEELTKTLEDSVSRDVLATCRYIAEAPAECFGAYVISQARSAADVLAVELLLAEAGATATMRVAPLFETLDDLNNAPEQLRQLFSTPGYLQRHGHCQEIMVGYSDSAKDAGRVAAAWALFEQQEKMLAVAKEFGVKTTFFHGKGGSVGRGGNPAVYKAILAHPPKTIDGRYRITEQGEMIGFNFGERFVAERSLDVHSAAVLRDSFVHHEKAKETLHIKQAWRDAMNSMSEHSCEAYRGVVRGHDQFVPYFRAATPESDLASLNLGSRPAKRNPKGGVESLRAIPWIFAWTQTRLNLPAWLGVSQALKSVEPSMLVEMYKEWPWFRTNLDVIELLLAKTETLIAAHYDRALVPAGSPELALGASLRADLEQTTATLLAVSGRSKPSEDNRLLMRALALRNPYVDVLNILQVELLKRSRLNDANDAVLDDALLITVNGIAAGLRNSG